MELQPTNIPGCHIVQTKVPRDQRGTFVKTFHAPSHTELGLRTDWREEYFSSSAVGVVRGMHFQLPPAEHAKLVFRLVGEVFDVVVDLRRGSPAFGVAQGFTLSADNGRGLYVPTGCAHGFVAQSPDAGMYYKVTSVHSPEHDAGIAWDSIDIAWPVRQATLSDRDRRHPRLIEFDTPFVFDPAEPAG